jgi:hypothetical protein
MAVDVSGVVWCPTAILIEHEWRLDPRLPLPLLDEASVRGLLLLGVGMAILTFISKI